MSEGTDGALEGRCAIRDRAARVLRSQDVVVLLKLAGASPDRTYASLAQSLGMSTSEVHAAVGRAKACGLA